jgi:hypothetical protein
MKSPGLERVLWNVGQARETKKAAGGWLWRAKSGGDPAASVSRPPQAAASASEDRAEGAPPRQGSIVDVWSSLEVDTTSCSEETSRSPSADVLRRPSDT